MPTAREVGSREAQRSLSRLVRQVEAGQEVVITRRGVPIARLVPVSTSERVSAPERRAALDEVEAILDSGWDLYAEHVNRDNLHKR